jgi:riboflavin-specific deaminase-like protein
VGTQPAGRGGPAGQYDRSQRIVRLTATQQVRDHRATGLPFVLINMAMSADGKIATADRKLSRFGSPRDEAHLHELRATVDAVLCGARTVAAENATLMPGGRRYRLRRVRNGLAEYNLRVIATRSGAIDTEIPLFRTRRSPIVVLTTERLGKQRLTALATAADQVVLCGKREIDFRAALVFLRRAWGVKRVLCEGGGELNAVLFAAGVVRELRLTITPYLFGGRDAPTIAEGRGAKSLREAVGFRLERTRRVGDELFCVYTALTSSAVRASS